MEAYCVKCKTKREMQNPVPLFNARGSAYCKGTCPVCGTGLMRLGATEAHTSLDREALVAQAKQKAAQKENQAGEKNDQVSLRASKRRSNPSGHKKASTASQRPAGQSG